MSAVERLSSTDKPAAKRLRSGAAAGGDRRWSALLPELLVPILRRLPSVRDRIRFGCVCSWWRSVLAEARHLLPPTAPLLLLPYTELDDLLCPPGHVHGVPVDWVHRVLLPDSQYMSDQTQQEGYRCRIRPKKVICGSSMGWLLVRDLRDIYLWNPLTKEEIPLPPPPCNFECGHNSCVGKVVLSSNPPSSSSSSQQPRGCCTVMAIRKCSRALSFCRIGVDGGGGWTAFEETRTFEDVICYRGRFYAATSGSGFLMLDVDSPSPKMAAAAEDCYWIDEDRVDDVHVEYGYRDYLVESSGELLMVSRVTKEIADADTLDYAKSTAKFVVHRLDFDTRTWSRVLSLGDQALFLGSSSSVSVSVAAAAATDTGHGYKRNCIYFLNVDRFVCCCRCTGSSDMGVFDLEDGSVTPFGIDMELHYYPQFWIDLAPW